MMVNDVDLDDLSESVETDIPEDVRDAIKIKDAFENFQQTEVWLYLKAWIEDQVRRRWDEVGLKPLENILEATQQEFTKGEMAFGRTVLAFPDTILTTAQETIDAYNARKEEEDGEEEEGLEFPDSDSVRGSGTAYADDG